eukprot:9936473-Lingulodinium_polyedra.AAC.1
MLPPRPAATQRPRRGLLAGVLRSRSLSGTSLPPLAPRSRAPWAQAFAIASRARASVPFPLRAAAPPRAPTP